MWKMFISRKGKRMKRALSLFLIFSISLPVASCRPAEPEMTTETTETVYDNKYQRYASMSPEEIVDELTMEQKAEIGRAHV